MSYYMTPWKLNWIRTMQKYTALDDYTIKLDKKGTKRLRKILKKTKNSTGIWANFSVLIDIFTPKTSQNKG